MVQAERSRGSNPREVNEFDFAQSLTEMSATEYFWGKARPKHKAYKNTAIYKQIAETVWNPRLLTLL
jgi:hypothetical protein